MADAADQPEKSEGLFLAKAAAKLHRANECNLWGGLSMTHPESELRKFVCPCINRATIAAGAIPSRPVFVVFGGLGVAGYAGHLERRY